MIRDKRKVTGISTTRIIKTETKEVNSDTPSKTLAKTKLKTPIATVKP